MVSNQLVVLFLVFFVSRVYANVINKNAALIDNVCRKTDNYNLCVSSLKSDPRSFNADVKGLGRIMYEISLAKAKDNIAQIQKLLRGANPVLRQLLNVCLDSYNGVVGDIMEGFRNLDSNNFKDAADKAERATDDVQTCDEAFDESRIRSPLKDRNKLFMGQVGIGSHTMGKARCLSFRQRIYDDNSEEHFGYHQRDKIYRRSLRSICPTSGRDNAHAPLDLTTPARFDNHYFQNIIQGKGLLISDNVLVDQDFQWEIREHVFAYASNQELFFASFANSMIKMGNINVLTGNQGEIRKNCRFVNV